MGVEIVAMAIPPGAGDADKGHARLDEPPRHQRLLAEQRRPIEVADSLRLAADVEEPFAPHQAVDALIRLGMAIEAAARTALLEMPAQQVTQLGPVTVIRFGDAL